MILWERLGGLVSALKPNNLTLSSMLLGEKAVNWLIAGCCLLISELPVNIHNDPAAPAY